MTKITVDITEFAIVRSMREPGKAGTVFHQEFRKAGRRVGNVLERDMRRVIRSGMPPAQAGFTSDVKGSSKPLAGPGGRLFKAITSEVGGELGDGRTRRGGGGDLTIAVGVMRTHEAANVAKIVHEGSKTFTVTPRMAGLFRAISAASMGKAVALRSERAHQILANIQKPIAPLRVGTQLMIPPRQFAKVVLEASSTPDLILDEFRAAMVRALKRLAA